MKVADSCNKVFQRHTWYLTEENISFSLFNENLPISVREKLAASIVKTTKKEGRLEVRKPELPEVKDSSTLADFAGPCSRLLFDLVGVSRERRLAPDSGVQATEVLSKKPLSYQ